MLYASILFVIAGLFGTLIALRLQALDMQERRTPLTRRGRIVVALAVGFVIALFVVAVNGIWWNCDLATDVTNCSVTWGY